MELPEKIRKYPWISAAVAVVLLLLLFFGAAYVASMLAETFGADRVACWIEHQLGIMTEGFCR